MRSAIIFGLGLAVLTSSAAAQQPPPAVVAVPAEARALAEEARFNGRLDADRRIAVVARVTGTLEDVGFRFGEAVEDGRVLFRIDPRPYAAMAREAEGVLRAARAARDRAALERDRQEELVSRQSAAQAALDNAEAEYQAREGEVMRAEAALERAEINLSYTEIAAPFAGRISTTPVSAGAYIGPESGVLATLTQLDPMHVEFPVPTSVLRDYLDRVEAGTASREAAVTLVLANGNLHDQSGTIDFIDTAVTGATDSVTLRARFENPEGRLLDGELVRVNLSLAAPQEEVAIPARAVQRDIQGAFVLLVGTGETVEQRRVTVGRITQGLAVIAEGLDAGERVITEGINKVRPGIVVDAAAPADG